jgi:PPE-repeat protein
MDFTLLPPEINSARIYTGPGSGPMLAAAAGWDALAADLQSTAGSYQAVISELTAGPWLGPASAAMAAAAAPYVQWTRSSATLAEQAANQAKVAAAAYEMAFAQTVPPPVIAANRSMLLALLATNLFGQNSGAIAATEAQYADMWAQDTGAMQGYAGASSSATALTPFASPASNSNASGQANQAAALAQAASTPAGSAQNVLTTAQQTFAAIPNALSNLANPGAFGTTLGPLDILDLVSDLSGLFVDPEIGAAGLGVDSGVGITSLPYDVAGYYLGVHTDDIVSDWANVDNYSGNGPAGPAPLPVIANNGKPVAAGLGSANGVGRLSVPPGWAAAAPAIRPSAVTLPAASVAAAEVGAGGAGSVFSQMALAGMAGRALAGTAGARATGQGLRERVGAPARKTTEPHQTAEPQEHAETPPQSGQPAHTPMGGPITSIAAELRELASLRDAGILTDAEFTEQKQRLLPH